LKPDAPIAVTIGPDEDKVLAKLEFLDGCTAVYAAQIGASSIKRLLGIGVQPIIVDNGHEIHDLLNEVSLAVFHGGPSWVERAMTKARAAGSPVGVVEAPNDNSRRLISSIEELDGVE
jgi:nitrogen fixation protein NifX